MRVAKITVDPTGTPHSLTLAAPVLRSWNEREQRAFRQDLDGGATARTFARPARARVPRELRLFLRGIDRLWLRSYEVDIFRSRLTIRVFPDASVAGTYADVRVCGADVEERYRRFFSERYDGYWVIDLPVVVMTEVG